VYDDELGKRTGLKKLALLPNEKNPLPDTYGLQQYF
jgi:hypothetical protein